MRGEMGYCEMLSRRYMDCRVYLIFCDALFPPFDASEMLVGTLPLLPRASTLLFQEFAAVGKLIIQYLRECVKGNS